MTDTFPAVKRMDHEEKNQYQAEGTHPAIISKGIFGNAQRLLETRKAMKQQHLLPHENPLHEILSAVRPYAELAGSRMLLSSVIATPSCIYLQDAERLRLFII